LVRGDGDKILFARKGRREKGKENFFPTTRLISTQSFPKLQLHTCLQGAKLLQQQP